MGLKVTNDMSVFNGMTLENWDFTTGSEHVVYLKDRMGNTQRVRIPAALSAILQDAYAKGLEVGQMDYAI